MIVTVVIAGLFGWWGWLRWQEEKELRVVLEVWDQQGAWRWKDWLASRPNPPDAENGATLVDRMVRLKPQNLDTELSDALLSSYDLWMHPQHRLHPEQVLELRNRITRCKELLVLFPDLPGKKTFVWPIPVVASPFTSPMNIHDVRSLLNILQDQFKVHLHDSQIKEACEDIRNGLVLVRTMDHQLNLVGRLVQIAFVQQCCESTQRLLAQSEPEEALLMQLQAELARFDEQRSWKKALFVETGCMNQSIVELQQGTYDISMLGIRGNTNTGSWWDKLKERVNTYFHTRSLLSVRQHAECLQAMFIGYQQTDQSWKVQRQCWFELSHNMSSEQINMKRLKHLMLPSIYMVLEAEMRLAAKLRTAQIALAAERFRRVENRWPTSQAELVGRFLNAVQFDPFDDQPLRMKRTDDGLVIYSIDRNNRDDQGMVFPTETVYPALDIGIKLWDVNKRRQPARPLPEEYLKMKKELKEQAGSEK